MPYHKRLLLGTVLVGDIDPAIILNRGKEISSAKERRFTSNNFGYRLFKSGWNGILNEVDSNSLHIGLDNLGALGIRSSQNFASNHHLDRIA